MYLTTSLKNFFSFDIVSDFNLYLNYISEKLFNWNDLAIPNSLSPFLRPILLFLTFILILHFLLNIRTNRISNFFLSFILINIFIYPLFSSPDLANFRYLSVFVVYPILLLLSGIFNKINSFNIPNFKNINISLIKNISLFTLLFFTLITADIVFLDVKEYSYSDVENAANWVNNNLKNEIILSDQAKIFQIYLKSNNNTIIDSNNTRLYVTVKDFYSIILQNNIGITIFSYDHTKKLHQYELTNNNYTMKFNSKTILFSNQLLSNFSFVNLSGFEYYTSIWKIDYKVLS